MGVKPFFMFLTSLALPLVRQMCFALSLSRSLSLFFVTLYLLLGAMLGAHNPRGEGFGVFRFMVVNVWILCPKRKNIGTLQQSL